MLSRRKFVKTGLLATSVSLFSSGRALSSSDTKSLDALIPDYNLPKSQMPSIIDINDGFGPGEIHVDPNRFFLYWTMPGNKAIRYTTGVGRGNLYHPGEFYIAAKKEWPRWTPTRAMIGREPELYNPFASGMEGGIENPLGARALYLYTRGKGDSLLRLHGTNNPRTIGGAVSNGCARLVNTQIIDLYNRVPVGTRVVLNPKTDGSVPHTH